jgi:hypothetical protein
MDLRWQSPERIRRFAAGMRRSRRSSRQVSSGPKRSCDLRAAPIADRAHAPANIQAWTGHSLFEGAETALRFFHVHTQWHRRGLSSLHAAPPTEGCQGLSAGPESVESYGAVLSVTLRQRICSTSRLWSSAGLERRRPRKMIVSVLVVLFRVRVPGVVVKSLGLCQTGSF